MANIWYGFLINLQFFTIIPIRKEIQMTKRNLSSMIITLPMLGLFIGIIYAFTLASLTQFTNLSNLALTFILMAIMMILTGGIHVDGWIDTSDAFFSYQDKPNRLKIMEDPRIGAFGVLGLLFLLVFKFLFIYEILSHQEPYLFIYIVFIPFFSRMLTGIGLILIKPAKKSGLGYLFKAENPQILNFYLIYLIPIVIILGIYNLLYLTVFIILLILIGILHLLFKRFFMRQFGGLTGDLSGASIEGTELILWLLMWLLHYYVTGGQ